MITCRQLYLAIRRLTRLYSSLRKNTYCKAKTIQRILSPEQVYGTTMTNYNLTNPRQSPPRAEDEDGTGESRQGSLYLERQLYSDTLFIAAAYRWEETSPLFRRSSTARDAPVAPITSPVSGKIISRYRPCRSVQRNRSSEAQRDPLKNL